jgi:hypothetical protein
MEDNGGSLWGLDPVHPVKEGYTRIADMICEAAVKLGGKTEAKGSRRIASLVLRERNQESRSPDRGGWRRTPQPQWYMEAVSMAAVPAEAANSRPAEAEGHGSTGA